MTVVNVVVTCTKDKRYPVSEECQLRNVPGGTLRERMQEWHTRTNRHWRTHVPVKDLYAGDHWANVRSFESSYFDIDIWVCSAGFGLVRFDDEIAPYAATFSKSHPDSLSIVCSGARSLDGLDRNLVPCDARLQAATGGARRSLNTRLAHKILRESRQPPTASSLSKRYRKLLNEQPPLTRYDRQPMSDDEVKKFILQQLKFEPSLRHTPLLRMLRDNDNACEQKRFASLYTEVLESLNG